MSKLEPVPAQKNVAGLVLEVLELALALASCALIVAGVFRNWGTGWAMIAAGVPFAAVYALKTARQLFFTRRR